MGTNYYRIPTEEEMEARKQTLIGFVNNLELSPENIESGFKLISPRKDWEWFSPWEMFIDGTNIHLGKRSGGWKFCWNFHDNKYYSNKEELLKKIFRLAKVESEWMSHYGHSESRESEEFNDILFYDRMKPIGYSKVWTPLHLRCPMGYVTSLDIEKINDTVYGPRDHAKGIYTCLEFVIHNRIEGYPDLIKLIKRKYKSI